MYSSYFYEGGRPGGGRQPLPAPCASPPSPGGAPIRIGRPGGTGMPAYGGPCGHDGGCAGYNPGGGGGAPAAPGVPGADVRSNDCKKSIWLIGAPGGAGLGMRRGYSPIGGAGGRAPRPGGASSGAVGTAGAAGGAAGRPINLAMSICIEAISAALGLGRPSTGALDGGAGAGRTGGDADGRTIGAVGTARGSVGVPGAVCAAGDSAALPDGDSRF